MDNPYTVRVPNVLEAMTAGEQGYNTMRGYMDERSISDARKEAQSLIASGDTQGALARLLAGGDVKGATVLGHYAQSANSVYGTPIWGKNERGEDGIGTFDKQGKFRLIDTGSFRPTPGIQVIDTPQGKYVIGSKSGEPLGGGSSAPGGTPVPQAGAGAPGSASPPGPGAPAGAPGRPPAFYPADNRGKARDTRLGTEEGEKTATMGTAKAALDTSLNSLDRMAFEADRIAKDPNLSKITGFQGIFPNWPGGGAANVNAKLETLKAQVAFGVLQAMREASKTGGALGAVSDRENAMLTSALAALDRAQSEGEFRAAMRQIVQYTQGAKQRLQQAYDTDYAQLRKPQPMKTPATQPNEPVRVNSPDEARRLPSGTPIVLPDGSPGVVP